MSLSPNQLEENELLRAYHERGDQSARDKLVELRWHAGNHGARQRNVAVQPLVGDRQCGVTGERRLAGQ